MKIRKFSLPILGSLAMLGLAALAPQTSTAQATFSPMAITQSSYTFSIVVSSNSVQSVPACVNAYSGSGFGNFTDTTYYEIGMYAAYPHVGYNSGIPPHGSVFTNVNNSSMTFVMPPNYLTNNELMIVNTSGRGDITTGTLNFNTPTTATRIAVLHSGGNGGCVVSWTATHSDNSTDTGSLNIPDWFNGGATVAWGANGRMNAGGFNDFNSSTVNNNSPYLYANTFAVSSNTPIVSVTFNYTSGTGVGNIYGISSANGNTTYTPVPVSGFNVTATVPYEPLSVTATMDSGTNLNRNNGGGGNTWFESGYYTNDDAYGLPPSGSTFTSMSQPTHTYQMGNYSTNNAILIDTNHQSANIVPASPAAATGLAFLTAGANIGGGQMTNICIIQHQDGVSETNIFFGYDWFNLSVPAAIAYEANGRVNINSRTLNNIGNTTPNLFETYFSMTDITSPVTNIVVKFKTAPGVNATTFIMAVSSTTNPIPPLITSQPAPATQEWYPSQSATISVQVAGSPPLTNTWLVESNGVYVPLTDGLDANGSTISGSSTTTLTIENLTLADGTNYEYIASNAEGSATSTNVSIVINTGTPVGPIIDSQFPTGPVLSVLTNHPHTTTFSVTVDASSSPPIYYQWYEGIGGVTNPIPGATTATYADLDTNNGATIFCIVSNFVGTATNTPVTIEVFAPSAPPAYSAAILAYHPVAFWPLNETNGNIAYDYAGTNDGTYTGAYTLGNPGLNPTPGIGTVVSAGFDGSTAYVDVPGAGDLNISGPITVVQFVQPPSGGDLGFTTSIGKSDQSYRLDVAGGNPHWADSGPDIVDANTINDGNWHQLVGVYDGTNQYLYVDGLLQGTPRASHPSGSLDDLTIGAAPDYLGGRNFDGNICQVAILTNALTASQVSTLYGDLGLPPTVSITPASPSVYAGSSITLSASISGTTPYTLQWYYIDTSNNSNNINGANSSTYTVSDASLAQGGYTYGINVVNSYGTNTASVVLSVQTGPAYLPTGGDISPLFAEAYVGAPVTYSVHAAGSLPIEYQWTLNGTNISGATASTVTLAAPCGTNSIQVSFTNSQNGGTPITSSVATLQGDILPVTITFNTNGLGWQLNGSVQNLADNVLELTDNNGSEGSTAFYTNAQYVGAFTASFTYQAGGSIGADGTCFIVQDNSGNTMSLGLPGGDLGYTGITNSFALEWNIYAPNGVGMDIGTNGYISGTSPTGQLQINSGDPILYQLSYSGSVLSVTLTDAEAQTSYSTSYNVGSLTPSLGGTDLAYIGFSGADGGAVSTQTISDFSFTPTMPPVALSTTAIGNGSFLLSWPAAGNSYYQLQAAPTVSGPWGAGPAAAIVGNNYQVTVSTTSNSQQYYRLVRIVCQ